MGLPAATGMLRWLEQHVLLLLLRVLQGFWRLQAPVQAPAELCPLLQQWRRLP